jgi:hypothetical protein
MWCCPLCRVDLVDRAVLFFDNLAQSGSGSSRTAGSAAAGASAANPVYNLLPDCLSALLAKEGPPLREEQMHAIMTQLLGYVKVGWGFWRIHKPRPLCYGFGFGGCRCWGVGGGGAAMHAIMTQLLGYVKVR